RCTIANADQIASQGYVLNGGNYEPAPRPADPNTIVYSKYAYNSSCSACNPPISIPSLVARDLSSGNETTLTSLDDDVSQPAWNPTGRYLAFLKTTIDQTKTAIYVMAFHPDSPTADYAHAQ